jgi:hypothetical protein
MFYSETMDRRFRFGDVIRGFATVTPVINNPPLISQSNNFQIDVAQADFYVVLSPCCSIKEGVVILCPLIRLRSTFLINPYLVEDFGRINRPMTPEQATPPRVWEKLPPSEKQKRSSVRINYAFVDLFVYAEHPFFPTYVLSARTGEKAETRQCMVDFRQSFTVRCEKVSNNSTPFEDVKLLQLSIEARGWLRNKLAAFFSRTPEEDRVVAE